MTSRVSKRALLIGINQYSDPRNNLKGCVNDALSLGKLLVEHFGFNREDIRLLTDSRATTSNIRSRLGWLLEDAGAGSVLAFHYSGHGSQVRDRDGDELDDGLDEILCPYDLDWEDPFTDDELREAIKSVPGGVNLTVILDCCHSGTGTRVFFKEPTSGRAPNPRYLVPPPDIAFRMAGGVEFDSARPERSVNMVGRREGLKVRRFGSSLLDQNVILIAGCRSDQTSADDWIENDYRGALTYSLWWSLRKRRYSLSYLDLIREAGTWLEAGNYDQIPQLEAKEEMKRWSFLGTEEHRPVLALGAETTRPVTEMLPQAPADTRVVFVHGIGEHAAGYSDRWRAAFNRYLALPLENYVEVLWDDIFDKTARRVRGLEEPPVLDPEEKKVFVEIREEIREIFEARQSLLGDIQPGEDSDRELVGEVDDRALDRGFVTWLVNFDEYIGDFIKYLSSQKVRDLVDKRLEVELGRLMRSGVPVVLISHSWGTVVGYNTLRKVTGGAIPLHFTLGSPLWMGPVRKRLHLDGARSACDNWINIHARGDIIGGALHPTYKVNHDYRVPSVGGQAHSSYFHPDNAKVQRDIVSRAVTDTVRLVARQPSQAAQEVPLGKTKRPARPSDSPPSR